MLRSDTHGVSRYPPMSSIPTLEALLNLLHYRPYSLVVSTGDHAISVQSERS
jgi:hypothetical protein